MLVAQLSTLCDFTGWDFQARILKWVAIPFSETQVSCIPGLFIIWATGEALLFGYIPVQNEKLKNKNNQV